MSPRLGALVRTALLIGLFGWSAFDDSLSTMWWLALAVILAWTLADFIRWSHEKEEPDD